MPDAPIPASRASAPQAAPVAREAPRPTSSQPPLSVRYYRRMRPNRVYPVVVRCDGAGRVRPGEPLVLRLLMAGAQVVPAEQTLDPSQPRAQVTFFVTPLARGWLRGERLEVVQQGKKVQELRLPCKVTTQCLTWIILALAFLVPVYIVPYFTTTPITHGDANPTKAMEYTLRDNCPHVWPIITEHLPVVAEYLEQIREVIGQAYGWAYYSVRNNNVPLFYWTVVFFLVLGALSWLLHLERRKRRRLA
jgi:hypothetical protein